MFRIPALKFVVSVVLLLGLGASSPAFGQKITGDIAGDVTDSSGAVVPRVSISAQNTGTGLTRTATTTNTGSYRISELPIGTYKVTALAQGFKTVVTSVEVVPAGLTHADFKLQIGQRTETVEVEGTAPLVELSPNNNNYVDAEKIESVPLNGRDFNSLLAITPGVQREPGGGFLAISINGSRTTSNNYFIDGLYNNDRYYGDSAINETGIVGIPATLFPPEAIAELSVQETPGAEYGVKGGAPINLVMKSGTNSWHGTAQWVRHTSFADADNYFSNHTGCVDPGSCQPTPLRNQQFGGTLGGPIIKEKTFFFLYYEGQRYVSSPVAGRIVPTTDEVQAAFADIAASGLTPNPAGEKLLSYFPTSASGSLAMVGKTTASANGFGVKIDHKLSSAHAISGKYIFGDSLQSAPPFSGLIPAPQYPADLFNSVAPSRAQLAGLSWTWTISNDKVLESRLGYTRFAQILGPNNKIDPKSLGLDTGPLQPGDFGVPYVYLSPLGYGGYIGGVQGYPLITRPDQSWDSSEHFSWTKGNHNIKIGGNFQRGLTNGTRNNARTGLTFGYPTFSPTAPASNPNAPGYDTVAGAIEQLLLGEANIASRNFGDTHRYIIQDSVGMYVQDDWKLRKGFNLTLGLRYDINGAIGETHNLASNFLPGRGLVQVGHGISALYNKDMHDFGPRLGFAWDLFGNGKSALRGGYSLTYDVPNFGAIDSPYSFAGVSVGAFSQPDLGVFPVRLVGTASNLPNSSLNTCITPPPLGTPPDYICIFNGPIFGTNPTGGQTSVFAVRQNLKTPRSHTFNLSFQHEMTKNNVLTIGYSGLRGQNLLIPYDLNASPIGSPCGFDFSSCDAFRPFASSFPNYQHVIQLTNLATSQYDSLQTSFNQRNWHGIDSQYNLTWSKCYDDNSVNRGGFGDYPQINNNGNGQPVIRDTRGQCDHDVRLNFNVGGVYSIPSLRPLGRLAGKGWQLSTIYTAISGRPFTALVGTAGPDPSGQGLDGNGIRASWDGTPVHYNTRNPDAYVQETFIPFGSPGTDPCGRQTVDSTLSTFYYTDLPVSPFYIPCPGTVGNSRRNQLIGPGLSQLDITVIKNTNITERFTVQFRWEVFNVLNRANFYSIPNQTIGGGISSGFGQIPSTPDVHVGNPVIAQGGPRNMNFALKIIF